MQYNAEDTMYYKEAKKMFKIANERIEELTEMVAQQKQIAAGIKASSNLRVTESPIVKKPELNLNDCTYFVCPLNFQINPKDL